MVSGICPPPGPLELVSHLVAEMTPHIPWRFPYVSCAGSRPRQSRTFLSPDPLFSKPFGVEIDVVVVLIVIDRHRHRSSSSSILIIRRSRVLLKLLKMPFSASSSSISDLRAYIEYKIRPLLDRGLPEALVKEIRSRFVAKVINKIIAHEKRKHNEDMFARVEPEDRLQKKRAWEPLREEEHEAIRACKRFPPSPSSTEEEPPSPTPSPRQREA